MAFLQAFTDYLETHAPLLAELGGQPRIHVERAGTNAIAPYVLIEGVRITPGGDRDESEAVALEVNAYAPTAREARHLNRVLVKAIDPPGLNPLSTRTTGRLTWTGGAEETAAHGGGKLFRVPGGAFGQRANWAKTANYEFQTRSDLGLQVTPDPPYAPAILPESLPQAVAGYLLDSVALTAALDGGGKVFLDLTTAAANTRPFVILEDVEDEPEGEADEDEIVRVSFVVQAKTLREATGIHETLCDLLDPPGMSRTGRRAVPLAWEGGEEVSAWRTSSTLGLLDGIGPAGADVWAWAADYQFRTIVT